MQVQLDAFHIFTPKVIILKLPRKWHKMIWGK